MLTSVSACGGSARSGSTLSVPRRQTAERHLDGRHDLLRVDVAHDDNGHAIGPVPGVVEVAQPRRGERTQDLRPADGKPVRVAGVVEEHRRLLVHQAGAGPLPQAPLLDDHAAFLVDFFRVERHAAGEVGEREQALVDQARLLGGDLQHVHGLVERRVRVHVRTESRAGGFEIGDHLARRVLGAVEGHVLEHVGEAALVVGLEHRARLDGQRTRRSGRAFRRT